MKRIINDGGAALIVCISWAAILVIDCSRLVYIELSQNITRHELIAESWDLVVWIFVEIGMILLFSKLYKSAGKNGK